MQFARLPDLSGQRGACSIPEAPSHFVGPSPYAGVRCLFHTTGIPLMSLQVIPSHHKQAHPNSPTALAKEPGRATSAELFKVTFPSKLRQILTDRLTISRLFQIMVS